MKAEAGGEQIWSTEDECLQIQERDRRRIFVFEKFEGKAFEHLAAIGTRYDEATIECLVHPLLLVQVNTCITFENDKLNMLCFRFQDLWPNLYSDMFET